MNLDKFIIGKTKKRRGEERIGEGRVGKKKKLSCFGLRQLHHQQNKTD